MDYSPSSSNQHAAFHLISNVDMAKDLAKKVSASFTRNAGPATVVVRSPKPRLSVASLDKGVLELTPEVSPSTSGETSGNSGKISATSAAPRSNSTGMTSLDSKFRDGMKLLSGHSSDTKKSNQGFSKQPMPEETVVSAGLTPIAETATEVIPLPVPSEFPFPRYPVMDQSRPGLLLNSCAAVITVEKAAAAKIFFECHYNTLLASGPSPRSIRLREFEGLLRKNEAILSPYDVENRKRDWVMRESKYLRECRVMKSRNMARKKGVDPMVAQYEVVKVLGKGSFGVVRLVKEKEDPSSLNVFAPKNKEVYAMKVIRKSDMLRNSQEGHLRAERDFLVASEGSRW